MDDIKLPPLSEQLVNAMDHLFPERCPDPKQSERDIWIAVGKRLVARFLREQFNRQQEQLLKG